MPNSGFWGTRLGHGPFGCWPPLFWKQLFYYSRPDVLTSKTRVPEWSKLQSEWRFLQALFCYVGPPSHILWNIKWPYLGVLLVAMGTAWYEEVRVWTGKLPVLDTNQVFYNCFFYSTFAMSLLLTFRIQRTYERWNQARSSIAGVGNGTTTIFMLAANWIKDQQLVDEFRRYCIVWPFAILQVCENSKTLDPRAAKLLRPAEYKVYSGSRKGRQVVVTKVRQLAYDANLAPEQFIAMENAIAATWKSAGDALRIRFQAMPHGLTLICTGFVEMWCLLLPLSLWGSEKHTDWVTLPAIMLIALLLLGVDELANQMEEPFRLLPLEDIVITYERDINRIRDELRLLKESRTEDLRTEQQEASTTKPIPGLPVSTGLQPRNRHRPPAINVADLRQLSTPSMTSSSGPDTVSLAHLPVQRVVSKVAAKVVPLQYQGRTTRASRQALLQEIELEVGKSDGASEQAQLKQEAGQLSNHLRNKSGDNHSWV